MRNADLMPAMIKTLYESNDETNEFNDAEKTKLGTVAADADKTEAANVDAAGAVMNSDASTAGMGFVLDEDNMASNSATKLATQQSIKAYVDGSAAGMIYQGGYNAATNTPDLDVAPSGIIKGNFYTCTVAGTFFTVELEVGDAIIAEIDDAAVEADWTVVQANLTAASIKALYESNAETNEFSDAEQAELASIGDLMVEPVIVSVDGPHTSAVTVDFKAIDSDGNDEARAVPFTWWLSSSETTGVISGTTPDGGVGFFGPGFRIADHTADLFGYAITDVNGDGQLTVVHAATPIDYYLWIEMGGRTVTSTLIDIN